MLKLVIYKHVNICVLKLGEQNDTLINDTGQSFGPMAFLWRSSISGGYNLSGWPSSKIWKL